MASYATVREVVLRCLDMYSVPMKEESRNRLVDSWHGIFKEREDKEFVEAAEKYVDGTENVRMPTPAHIKALMPKRVRHYEHCPKCATGVRSNLQVKMQRWIIDHPNKCSTHLLLWYPIAYRCDCGAGRQLTIAKWPCDGCLALKKDGDMLQTLRCYAYKMAAYQVQCVPWKKLIAEGGIGMAPTGEIGKSKSTPTPRQKAKNRLPEAKKIPLKKATGEIAPPSKDPEIRKLEENIPF